MFMSASKILGMPKTQSNNDPYFNLVVFLMNGSGKAAGDTTFSDTKGHTVTGTNGPVYSATQQIFGLNTIQFNGTNSYILATATTDFAFGTGDFTIDSWMYQTAYSAGIAGGSMFGTVNGAKTGYVFHVGQNDASTRMTSNASGGWGDSISVTTAGNGVGLNAWTLMSFEREGDTMRIYKNGILVRSATGAAALNFSGTNALIGRFWDGQYDRVLTGFLGPLRATKVARYKGLNFPVPTGPFPTS